MKPLPYLLFGLFSLLILSCEREEINNSDQNYPISLSLEKGDDQIKLNWTATNVSTFEEYRILRSTDSISDDVDALGFGVSVLDRIQDVYGTSFIDQNLPFAEAFYYKVVVNIGSRILISPTVKVETDQVLLPLNFSHVMYPGKGDQLYFYDGFGSGRIWRYDILQDELADPVFIASDWVSRFSFGENDGQPELYQTIQASEKIMIYDALTFTTKGEYIAPSNVNTTAFANGFLMYSSPYVNSPFQALQRSTLALVSSANLDNGNQERTLGVLSEREDQTIALAATPYQIDKIILDGQGQVLAFESEFLSSSQNFLSEIVVSPDQKFFLPYQNGEVFDENLSSIGTIGTTSGPFTDYAFSPDGTRLFGIRSNTLLVEAYNFPSLTRIETLSFPLPIQRIFTIGDKLYLIGIVFVNGQQQAFLEPYEL